LAADYGDAQGALILDDRLPWSANSLQALATVLGLIVNCCASPRTLGN
jgi:hypothetical protein